MRGNFWAGLASGFGTGITLGKQIKEMGVNSKMADVVGQSTTDVASGEDQYQGIQQAYENAMAGAATPEEKAAVEKSYAPVLDAATKVDRTKPASVAYSLGTGDTYQSSDKPFSLDEIDVNKMQQRAGIYRNAGMNIEANQLETNAQQRRLTANQLEQSNITLANTKKLQGVETATSEYAKKLQKIDSSGNPLPMSNDDYVNIGKYHTIELAKAGLYSEAQQSASQAMEFANKKIQLETNERAAAVRDGVAAATTGNFKPAIDAYNRFIPDGAKITSIDMNKDGTLVIHRVSTIDGTDLGDTVVKGGVLEFSEGLKTLADPNAAAQYAEKTFQHDIETRKAKAAEISAAASATSAAAQAKESGVKVDAMKKEMLGYGAISKPDSQRTPEEKEAVTYITGKATATSQTPEKKQKVLDDVRQTVKDYLTAGKGAMDSLSPEAQARAQAILVRSDEMARAAVEAGLVPNSEALFKRAAAEYDAGKGKPAAGGIQGAGSGAAGTRDFSALWKK